MEYIGMKVFKQICDEMCNYAKPCAPPLCLGQPRHYWVLGDPIESNRKKTIDAISVITNDSHSPRRSLLEPCLSFPAVLHVLSRDTTQVSKVR